MTFLYRLRLRPRCLKNVLKRDLSTTILGTRIEMPIGIAPTAMQRMAHSEGECATVRAAEKSGIIYVTSTLATTSLEDIADAAQKAIKWFQLYIYTDRELMKQLVTRAEIAGYKALVLTVDTPFLGLRLADLRNKFTLPPHLTLANFEGSKVSTLNSSEEGSALNNYIHKLFDASLEWTDVAWLKSLTTLPIILKGILTAEDASIAADVGVAGIIVSNHGARQVDGTPATIECLPEIVRAVGHRLEVYMDGGIRDGTDVFKALGLGAKMVFIGRPAIWGLTHSGQEGVEKILNILKTELDSTMAMTGCSTTADIKRSMIVHKNFYSNL